MAEGILENFLFLIDQIVSYGMNLNEKNFFLNGEENGKLLNELNLIMIVNYIFMNRQFSFIDISFNLCLNSSSYRDKYFELSLDPHNVLVSTCSVLIHFVPL